MSDKKLEIISSDSEGLWLDDSGNILTGDSGAPVVVTNYAMSPDKPIRCSELYSILKGRAWNKLDGTRFINLESNQGELMYRFYIGHDLPSSDIDEIDNDVYSRIVTKTYPQGNLLNSSAFFMQGKVLLNSEGYTSLLEQYKKTFGNMNATKEVYFFDSSKSAVDILEEIITADLVKYGSDIYTDTLSLNELISYSSAPGISGKVDLNVQYTKGGKVYSRDIFFKAFSYDSNGKLERDNFIEDIDSDVRVEYINGIIKASPIGNKITECILNNCTITYGK